MRARSEASIHGSVRAFTPTEANSRFRETGRIPCATHELPCEREKIPCPRRNKFRAAAGLRIWESACNTLGLWHELASGIFEPAVNLEKSLPNSLPSGIPIRTTRQDSNVENAPLPPERRADELQAVIARPFGRPRKGSELTSVRVDEQRGRHPDRLADRLEVLENLGAGIRIIRQPFDSGLLQPVFRLVQIASIDVDRNHLEIRCAELVLQGVERRHFLAAWHAPGRPQIKENGPAAPVGERFWLAGSVVERQFRQLAGLVGDLDG